MPRCPFCKSEMILSDNTKKNGFSHDYYKCHCQLYHICGNWVYLTDDSCYYEENKYDIGDKQHKITVYAVKPQRWGYIVTKSVDIKRFYTDKQVRNKLTVFIFR